MAGFFKVLASSRLVCVVGMVEEGRSKRGDALWKWGRREGKRGRKQELGREEKGKREEEKENSNGLPNFRSENLKQT